MEAEIWPPSGHDAQYESTHNVYYVKDRTLQECCILMQLSPALHPLFALEASRSGFRCLPWCTNRVLSGKSPPGGLKLLYSGRFGTPNALSWPDRSMK